MKKIESLKKLREVVVSVDKLADGEYLSSSDDGCNCVIGHLLKLGNVSDEQLEMVDTGYYNECAYGIEDTIEAALNDGFEEGKDFVGDALTSLGFNIQTDVTMLGNLQRVNDTTDGNKQSVLNAIDKLISELEEK